MDFSFSIDKILKVLKRFFLLMIVFAIVFYALGYYLTKRSTNISYYSYTELYIHTIATDSNEYVKYIETEARYVDTYLLTIDTYKFYEELRNQLPEQWKDKVTPGDLKGCVSATKRSDSAIIRFTVYTYSSELTFAITQTLSTYMDDYLWNNYSVKSVQIVEEPRPPATSVSQNKFLSLAMAVVGALIAFSFGYFKVLQDRRILSSDDLEQYEVPVLGVIPAFNSSGSKKGGKYAYSGYSSYSEMSNKIEENAEKSSEKKKK
ncbi:MAG: hypothetical protein J6V36_01095 [Clostridia bacterium]|nr:hypothetical protein [Clostridia bacterium]